MSTTTTTAVTSTTLVGMLPTMTSTAAHCPTCGQDASQSQSKTAEDSQRRIMELEGQVQNLNVQAKDTGEIIPQTGHSSVHYYLAGPSC